MRDRPMRAALIHPVALGALGLLLVNDHVLKAAWPGWWSGKLSDVAALVVGPIAVAALWQAALRGRVASPWRLGVRIPAEVAIALGFAVVFVAVKLDLRVNAAYAVLIGILGWPIGIAGDLLVGRPIQALGLAPTVLDAGDLIALPAVLVGWWLAVGAPTLRTAPQIRASSRLMGPARVAVLAGAWFALAATSYSVPQVQTDSDRDAVTVTPGGVPVERAATIHVSASYGGTNGPGALPPAAVRIQARPVWPFNEPPAHFVLTIENVGSASGAAPVVDVARDRCAASCAIVATVAIDWPAGQSFGGTSATSVAWELVGTTDARPPGTSGTSYGGSGAPGIDVEGTLFTPAGADAVAGIIWLLLIVLELAAYVLGTRWVRGRLEPSNEPGSTGRRALDALMTITTAVLAGLVGLTALTARLGGAGSPIDGFDVSFVTVAWAAAGALVIGLGGYLRGSGALLAVVAVAFAIVALPAGGIVVGAASPSFAARGLQIGVLIAVLLAIVLLVAPSRRGAEQAGLTDGRLAFLATQGALMGVLALASPNAQLGASLVAIVVLAFAVRTWWDGSGWLLGLASLLIVGVTALMAFIGGPNLIAGPSWTGTDRLVQAGLFAGGLIGLSAALGWIVKRPKPEGWRPSAAAAAAAAGRPHLRDPGPRRRRTGSPTPDRMTGDGASTDAPRRRSVRPARAAHGRLVRSRRDRLAGAPEAAPSGCRGPGRGPAGETDQCRP